MTTASGSSASHRIPKRLRPDFPLIACGECKQKIVMEYQVKECPNKGRIFYKCSDRNWDGTGCRGWYWEEEYVEQVQKSLAKAAAAAGESACVYDEAVSQQDE